MASINIDQCIALNDEMAALCRAGVPLQTGLPELGKGLPRRTRALFDHVAARLRSGQTLEQALAAPEVAFPPAYRAVVAAGVRSGNLPAALESISATARKAAEIRRLTASALAYPLFLLWLAYVLIKFAMMKLVPEASLVYTAENYRGKEIMAWLARAGESPIWQLPWVPVVGFIVLALFWLLVARKGAGNSAWPLAIPTFGKMIRCGRIATFAEILALLIEHRTPMAEALLLAADASGDTAIKRGAKSIAQRVEQGGSNSDGDLKLPRGFPPFIAWLLSGAGSTGRLPILLRQSAAANRANAVRIGQWLSVYFPIGLTAVVGGGATAVLFVLIVGPWVGLLHQIDQP